MIHLDILDFNGEVFSVQERPETRFMGVLVSCAQLQPNFRHGRQIAFTVNPSQAKPIHEKEMPVLKRVRNLYCRICGTTDAPEWRRGPEGPKTLCNACGIKQYRKIQAEKSKKIIPGQVPLERLIHKKDLDSAINVKNVKDGVNWVPRVSKSCSK